MTKTIYSLDMSLNGSGIIIGTPSQGVTNYYYFSPLQSDIKNEHCIPVDKNDDSITKLDKFICWYLSQVNKIDLCVIESPSLYGVNSSSAFKDIYGIVEYLNRRLDIETLLITPISNKLFFTNNAKAEKIDMVNQSVIEYGDKIDFENISRKRIEDIADSLSLFTIGVDYLKCNRLPAKKGGVDTSDIKYYDTLPLHRKMVISKLYNRDDLYQEAKKQRDKLKKEEKKGK